MATIVAPPWEEQPTAGGIADAPSDGKTYGRKDAAWAEVTSGGGGGGAATVLWANRPAASAAPGGEIIVSDLGYQKMYSDGTNWRPVGGRLRLRSQRGLIATPVAILTGPGLFAVPGGAVVIPAGLLTNDAAITVHADSTCTATTTGFVNLIGYIGTVNTVAGSNSFAIANITSGNAGQLAVSTCLKFASPTTATSRSSAGCGETMASPSAMGTAGGLQLRDFKNGMDTAAVMYVNIGTTQVADGVSKLVTYDVFVEM